MKKKKILAIFSLITVCLLLVSCGARKEEGAYYYVPDEPMDGDYWAEAESSAGFSYNESKEARDDYDYSAKPSPSDLTNLKLTYTANINIETLEFDKSLTAILDAVNASGGFVSYRNEGGGYTSVYGNYSRKWINLECRIPAGSYQAFMDGSADFGTVTSLLSSMEDITAQYLDTESRLNSLYAQRDRLTEMMKSATLVSDLIQIEAQLSEVIYQIENYTARKNTYDNLVAYSTVNISLNEVSVVTHQAETFWDRLIGAISDSFREFVAFLENVLFALIYLLPFAIVIALIAIPVIRLIRKKRALKKKTADTADPVSIPKEISK